MLHTTILLHLPMDRILAADRSIALVVLIRYQLPYIESKGSWYVYSAFNRVTGTFLEAEGVYQFRENCPRISGKRMVKASGIHGRVRIDFHNRCAILLGKIRQTSRRVHK